MFDNIINLKFPVNSTTETTLTKPISFEAENATRYVGGYVVATFLKKQKSADSKILTGLDHLTEQNTEVINRASSAMWVQEVNRDGLTHITEAAQDVFVSIETCKKANLTLNNAHKLDETTWHHLENDIFSDCDVQFYWCMTGITLKIDNDKAKELFNNLWITI